jgi:hypothetical protein
LLNFNALFHHKPERSKHNSYLPKAELSRLELATLVAEEKSSKNPNILYDGRAFRTTQMSGSASMYYILIV